MRSGPAVEIAGKRLMAAHHAADAVEQHGAAHHARDRCGRGAEERAAAHPGHHAAAHHAATHRGTGISGLLRISLLRIPLLRRTIVLARLRPRAPHAARSLSAGPY